MSFAHRIDHTLLRPEATRPEIHQLADEALRYGFACVCVNGVYVADVARALEGSAVKTCATVGFPLGACKTITKAVEATTAVKDGAEEIDFVAHLPHLLDKDVDAAKAEFREIVRAARGPRPDVVVKVIIESAVLIGHIDLREAEARIESACRAARESGCDFVKTSTGFHPAGGASVRAVQWMKKHSGGLYVKAAGGIRTRADAERMLQAGADRLGCSASVTIVSE